jgi:hypothetical protein
MTFYGSDYFADEYKPTKEDMAREEIIKRTANLFRIWQWRRLKTEITIDWPIGWTKQDLINESKLSLDPNDHYRAWLEDNVGKQGWAWDWRIHNSIPYYSDSEDLLAIRFRKPEHATMFALRYV